MMWSDIAPMNIDGGDKWSINAAQADKVIK